MKAKSGLTPEQAVDRLEELHTASSNALREALARFTESGIVPSAQERGAFRYPELCIDWEPAGAVHFTRRAWAKFQRICAAQGWLREPPVAAHKAPVPARVSGRLAAIDNRRLARVAKLAGAPEAKAAGVELHQWLGNPVEAGEPLFTVHAETPGELAYALDYVAANPDMLRLDSD